MGPSLSYGGWIVCLAIVGGLQSPQAPAAVPGAQPSPGREAPARDRAPDAERARIRGHVTDDLGNPLPRVWVAAHSSALAQPVSTLTDGEGRFELAPLEAGRYLLIARKPGYGSAEWIEGTPGAGRQLNLVAGQTLERIAIVLRRGAVLTGRVVDEGGAPVPDVTVRALQHVTRRGRRRVVAAGRTATTDDRGEYRLWGLPEGTYLVSAESPPPIGPFAPTSGAGYSPTFAPGAAAITDATRFSLVAGQELTADIRLVLDRLVRVTGTVVSSGGDAPSGGTVRLVASGDVRRDAASGPIMDGGRFSLPAVPPGSYLLVARTGPSPFPGLPRRRR